jgi:hypothetical protein
MPYMSLNKKYAKTESKIISLLFSSLNNFQRILSGEITKSFVLYEWIKSCQTRFYPF